MSFTRAFSHKRNTSEAGPSAPTQRTRASTWTRPQISSPVVLISTSNAHVKNAHAIAGTRPIEIRKISTSSSVSSISSRDSDDGFSSAVSEHTLTDASSVNDSPIDAEPETKRLSYFKPTVVDVGSSSVVSPEESPDPEATPKIPQRAPSHSKSAHETLHRKRSVQRMLQHSSSQRNTPRSSVDPASPARSRTVPAYIGESPQETPFDDELAQLDEVARDFSNTMRTPEEDADVMQIEKRGLASFSATEYMSEIQILVHNLFADEKSCFMQLGGFF